MLGLQQPVSSKTRSPFQNVSALHRFYGPSQSGAYLSCITALEQISPCVCMLARLLEHSLPQAVPYVLFSWKPSSLLLLLLRGLRISPLRYTSN